MMAATTTAAAAAANTTTHASVFVERWVDDDVFGFSSLSGSSAVMTRGSQEDSASLTDSSHDAGDVRQGAAGDKLTWSGAPKVRFRQEEHDDDGEEEEDQGDTLKVSDLNKETLAQLASYAKKPAKGKPIDVDEEAWDVDVVVPEQLSMDSVRLVTTTDDTTDFFSMESSLSDTSSNSLTSRQKHALPSSSKGSRRTMSNHSCKQREPGQRTASDTIESYDDFDFNDAAVAADMEKNLANELQTRLRLKTSGQRRSTAVSGGTRGSEASAEKESGLVVNDDLDVSPGRLRARTLSNRLREAAKDRKQKSKDRPTTNTAAAAKSSIAPQQPRASTQRRDRTADVSQSSLQGAGQSKWKRGGGNARSTTTTTYGDGHELDTIKDLTIAAPASSVAAASSSSSRRKRTRRKKEPYLIRNLGSSGNGSMQVGDMTWNPILKRWEGNEQEGREFDSAVRGGSARPALITRLSLGSSGIALGGVIAGAGVAEHARNQPPTGRTKTNVGVAHVVGEMVFDPLNLSWKRNDGVEEVDPFAEMEEEEEGEMNIPTSRKIRQRTVSAEDVALHLARTATAVAAAAPDWQGDVTNNAGLVVVIRSSLDRADGYASLSPPIQHRISHALWMASRAAEQRHQREMTAFKQPPADARRSTTKQEDTRDRHRRPDHLYFIRTLARHSSHGQF